MRVAAITPEVALYVCQNMRAEDAREIYATRFSEDPEQLAREVAARGPFAWAVGLDMPIALIGALEVWPGVWEMWMFATPEFNKIGRRLTRFVRDAIVPGMVKVGVRRAQAHSIEGHTVAHRWMETLGGVREAELPDYGKNGETFVIYSWRPDTSGRAHSPLSVVPLLGGL